MESEEIQKRIADLDLVCKALQEKLQKCVDNLNNLEKLSLSKSEYHDRKINLESFVSQNNDSIFKNLADLQEKFDSIKREMSSFNVYFDTHKKRIGNQEDKLQAINHELDYQKQNQIAHQMKLSALDQLQQKSDLLAQEQDAHRKQVLSMFNMMKSSTDIFGERLKSTDIKMQFHDSKLAEHDTHKEALNKLGKSLESQQQLHKNLEGFMQTCLRDISNEVQIRIDSIPKIELPKPVDVNSIVQASHKDLADKFHSIQLDIENCNLKSTNNDVLIKQFEKKLENIYLLLKKHEITK